MHKYQIYDFQTHFVTIFFKNKPSILFHTVKSFQEFLPNKNNSIYN